MSVFVLAVIAVIFLWDWNWFRPLAEGYASAAMGRDVRIRHFDLDVSRETRAVFEGVTIENPPGFGEEKPLGTAERLSLSIRTWPALGGHIVIPEIRIEKPQGDLRSNADGMRNWEFAGLGDSEDGAAGSRPEIGQLFITDGNVHFTDQTLGADFTVKAHTEAAKGKGEPLLVASAAGTYNSQRIDANFRGGSLISLREEGKPYPVDLHGRNGDTKVSLQGSVLDPLKLGGANVDLELQGKTLNDLQPLIGVPMVETPPYHLKGRLDYDGKTVRFRNFSGTVGQSDLSGTIGVDPGEERPRVTGDLKSKRVVLADLGGFIGAAPGKADQPGLSAAQKAEHAAEEASPRLLPDQPFNIPEIQAAGFNIHYEAGRIEGRSMPLDNLIATLRIENGKVTLDPLNFGVGEGRIAGNIVLDARQSPIDVRADIDFQRVDLRRIMQSTEIFEGAGTIGGRGVIESSGNSVADMLGRGNGELKLFMAGGNISALLVNLAGLDLGNSILSALGLPQRTGIRCMVSDFALAGGSLKTRTFYLDTEEANIVGKGTIDLDAETLDYRIETEPKKPSIGALPAPINITGRLKDPSIGPDPETLAARAGASTILGVVLTPLAALLPTIQFGLGEDNDCTQSIRRMAKESEALPSLPGGTPEDAQ
ncbi:MAG: AsmA family protein [Parvibaculum sp.]|nr:AsmA family protein [Parvibaculum sp.]